MRQNINAGRKRMDIDPNNTARALVNAAIGKIPYAGG
jgi:hypothetical protein